MNKSGYPDPTAEKAIASVMKEQKRASKMMELKDTIPLMISEDYKERFKAEYYQLKIRYKKLRNMVDHWDSLQFKPTIGKQLYRLQLDAMSSYILVMEHRAKGEGVTLDEVI